MNLKATAQFDARKSPLGPGEIIRLIEGTSEILVVHGNRVNRIDMASAGPRRDQILSSMLGPSGKLRAPSLRHQKTVVVGFSEEVYQAVCHRERTPG